MKLKRRRKKVHILILDKMKEKEILWTKNNLLKLFGELVDEADKLLENRAKIMGLNYRGFKEYKKENRVPEITREQLRLAIIMLEELGRVALKW